MSDDVRPRYGLLTRTDGSADPLVFLPTEDPNVFEGLLASTEKPVSFAPGDRLTVDVIGPGQSVSLRGTTEPTEGAT